MMERTLLGNPHSAHDAGARTKALVDDARDATLTHLNAPFGEYAVVFTSGATGAMRLLAEAFPWSAGGSEFAYTRGNHTSVVGARGCAMAAGGRRSSLRGLRPTRRRGGGSPWRRRPLRCD